MHIKMSASLLRLDAIQTMKIVLAGTAANKLQDVLEAAFGGDEEKETEDPEGQPEDEPSTSQGESSLKQKASPSGKTTKSGICTLSDASCYFPTDSNAKSSAYLHGGVDSAFFSSHISSQKMKSAGYEVRGNRCSRL